MAAAVSVLFPGLYAGRLRVFSPSVTVQPDSSTNVVAPRREKSVTVRFAAQSVQELPPPPSPFFNPLISLLRVWIIKLNFLLSF